MQISSNSNKKGHFLHSTENGANKVPEMCWNLDAQLS